MGDYAHSAIYALLAIRGIEPQMRACVIGHGPSATGKAWGLHIDECDHVTRMFDCSWQAVGDYGSRYDAGLMTLTERQLNWFSVEATRKPKEWWLYCTGPVYDIETQAPQKIFSVEEDRRYALLRAMQAVPEIFGLTRGTAAACHAMRSLRPTELVLVGFDEVMRGRLMNQPYPKACVEAMSSRPDFFEIRNGLDDREGRTKTLGHDLSVELSVLEACAREMKCHLMTAQEVF